jgi:hypothetical protein
MNYKYYIAKKIKKKKHRFMFKEYTKCVTNVYTKKKNKK